MTTKAFLTSNYHTLVFIQRVPRTKFMSYVKHFAKTPTFKLFFHHSDCRTHFVQKIVRQLLWSPFLRRNLLVQDVKRHLPTRIKEHLQIDTKSHIPQHLNENPNCRDLCYDSYLIEIDHALSSFRLKLKEALHITWLKPVLSKQKNHVHSFLQGWNPPFLRELPPFRVPPSFWSKYKKFSPSFWEPSKLVHVNCKKHFKMKVLRFILY